MVFLELTNHYRARAAELGADLDHFAFCVRGLGIATEPDYVLADDDMLYTDFGCIYQGYYSDAGATLAMCDLPPALLKRYIATQTCIEAAVEMARPGVKASQVRAAMWETLNQDGAIVSYPHGHGLGLELRGYPIIVPDNGLRIRDDCVDVPSDLPLEADMVFSLEVGIFMPGVGSLQNEQTFIVTPDGCQQLVPQDRERPVGSPS
jgi:Xaa-Pro aminopeptidase